MMPYFPVETVDRTNTCKTCREGQLFDSQWKLPLDILDCILQQLAEYDDLHSLKMCALVCTDLTHLCQRRIFNQIMLANFVSEDMHVKAQTPTRFEELLNQNPKVADYVRSLHYQYDPLAQGPDSYVLQRF
ncbi:hypothetical protein D9619_001290 [Psilocybe cf. subviscida]|uniref:F-box domain-containing protein n=1 Tax=Psilocybe cf. subviscida TaxID=2480587 RepID=A0A8H5BD50_9AGAR|nr:hypothetical protein D9619_001290 [Psilocybe cf. subviscida]